MLNHESFKNLTLYLFENNDTITYYGFLESIKRDSNKILVESIQNGFVSLFEDNSTSLTDNEISNRLGKYWDIANKLNSLVEKLKGSPEVNKALFDIRDMKPGSGKLEVKTINPGEAKGLNAVTDFNITPGNPDESDSQKAKAIIVSSVIPFVIMKAQQMAKTEDYADAAVDFIVDSMGNGDKSISHQVNDYEYRGVPFFQYYRTTGHLNNLTAAMTKAQGIVKASSGKWKPNVPYKQSNDIVFWNDGNWKPTRDLTAEENVAPPPDRTDLWERYGTSKSQQMSTTSRATATGNDEDAEKGVGEVLTSQHGTPEETETNVDVKKLMALLPDSKEKQALMMLYGIGAPRMDLREIGDKMGVSHQTVKNLVDRAIATIRSKSKITPA